MAGFPRLIPAFSVNIFVETPKAVGTLSSGPALIHVPFIPNTGHLRSEPGYEATVNIDAVFDHGVDFIKADPDGKHVRLDVQSLAKDKISGGLVRLNYTGTIDMASTNGKVLRGDADAATTDFGGIFSQVVFETGAPELKALEGKVYVGSGRFILEPGKPVVVEYKISEVAI